MRNKRRLRALFNMVHVLGIIIVLVGCMPAPPTPTPTDTSTPPPTATDTPSPTEPPTPTDTPTATPVPIPSICETIDEPENQESNGYFLISQMIVTGPHENIDVVISEVAPDAILLQICDLSFLSTLSFDPFNPPTIEGKEPVDWFFDLPDRNDEEQRRDLSMRLYEFRQDDVNIEDEISRLNQFAEENELFVFADPNYLTGLSQNPTPCFLPTSGGSGGGGKPFGGFGIPALNVNPPIRQQFRTQWALNRVQGIELPPPNSSLPKGKNIRIGVFDTVPLPISAIPDPFPAWPTALDFASIRNAVTPPGLPLSDDYLDGSDHGLFVAGLIHVVAPESKIHLIRVLNDEGCGTASDLAQAIMQFINQMGTTSDTLSLQNVVMSLSLGMSKPIRQPDQTDIEWEKIKNDFVAFETAIFEARRLKAIILAASGNESTQTSVEDMVLPAAYNKIYGVAATNPSSNRSCFSNKGDIAAPGGDGGKNGSDLCAPRSDTWDKMPVPCPTNMARCRYGVISLALRATGGPGYIFWAGTSFSTPLVTGLAARTLDKAGGKPIIAECLMKEGASATDPNLGEGKINVTLSLNNSSC